MQQSKRPVIYPLGRLTARQFSPTATGIDRLDLRYAKWLLDEAQRGRQVIYIRQVRNTIYRLSDRAAERMIVDLWRRWVRNEELPIETLRLKALNELFWLKCRMRDRLGPFVDPSIINSLANGSKPVYLNPAHIGAQFEPVHRLLREKTGADLYFYLHDIIPIDFPEYFSNPKGDLIHRGRVEVMSRQGKLVLVNSNHTGNRFAAYCRQNQLPTPATELLKIGVEDHIIEAAQQPRQPLPRHLADRLDNAAFFITIGTIEPRKNHMLLLHIWRRLCQEYDARGEACPKLVIVGQRGWENENVLDLLERSPQIRQHVIELNGLGDKDMIALIRHARALLMPSFEEGWGMPLAEALALGTPAICSDIPAHRECGQNQAIYLDPLDGTGWKNQIEAMIQDSERAHFEYVPDDWAQHLVDLQRLIDEPL